MRTRFLGLLLALCSIVLALWGFWFEPRQLVAREVTLSLPGWPAARGNLRIALLADLHVGSPHHDLGKLRQIVGCVNAAKPDVVLFLGDLVIQGVRGGSFVPPEASAAELANLKAPYGVYGVMGNHDWWLDAPRVATALKKSGMILLEDTSARLSIKGHPLWLAGVSDYTEGRHDLQKALRGIPQSQAVILLTHNPDIFPEVPAFVSLTVAGHTHGGQVNLPILGRPLVPSKFGQRYAAGLIVENGRHLFVSTGTGTSMLPVRFRVPPEVVVLNVH